MHFYKPQITNIHSLETYLELKPQMVLIDNCQLNCDSTCERNACTCVELRRFALNLNLFYFWKWPREKKFRMIFVVYSTNCRSTWISCQTSIRQRPHATPKSTVAMCSMRTDDIGTRESMRAIVWTTLAQDATFRARNAKVQNVAQTADHIVSMQFKIFKSTAPILLFSIRIWKQRSEMFLYYFCYRH